MDTQRFLAEIAAQPRLGSFVHHDLLDRWPRRLALREALLTLIAGCLADGTDWTERQLTDELALIASDPVTLRRDLVDAGLLWRTPDGRQYRRASIQ